MTSYNKIFGKIVSPNFSQINIRKIHKSERISSSGLEGITKSIKQRA